MSSSSIDIMADVRQFSAASPPHSVTATGLSVILPSWYDPDFIAPLLFGTLLQFGIFCILAVQTVVYFARQGHSLADGRFFQLYVAVVLVFTMLQVVNGVWRVYCICVLLRTWAHLPHPWFEPVLNAIVVWFVHGFFALRCYKLSQSKRVLRFILAMLLAQGVALVVAAVYGAKADQVEEIRTTVWIIMSATVALDAVISSTLFVSLWRQRTGKADIDTVVLRTIRMVVESLLPCLICLVLILISASSLGVAPLGSLFPLIMPIVAPLYATALLTTINSWARFRRQLDNDHNDGQPSVRDNIQFAYSDRSRRTSQMNSYPLASLSPAQRGSIRYGIALTSVAEVSTGTESGSDQLTSKVTHLSLDGHALSDRRPTLPSKQASNPPMLHESV